MVGVGGAGMSAIATVLHAMGHEVSGSDLRESAVTERLRALGIDVSIGHRADNVAGADLVTHSTAVTADNTELAEARRRGLPVLTRAETLAAIASRRRCIAVAGTHGKTTTASMLALILVEAGLHPSFLIGGDVNEIGTNAVWDSGEWIVVEADESDGTFLHLVPDIAVVTNVEADHLDHYGSFDAVRTAFAEFLGSARLRVVGSDDPEARAIGRAVGADLVGIVDDATHAIAGVATGRSSVAFDLLGPDGGLVAHLAVSVPGLHNAKNAAVAAVAALHAGAPSGGRGPGAGPVRGRGPPLRVPRRVRRGDLRGRLRPPADRGPGRPGRRPQRGVGPGRRRVPAAPLLEDGRGRGRLRRRLRRRRCGGADGRLRRRRDPRPGCVGPAGGRRRPAGPARPRAVLRPGPDRPGRGGGPDPAPRRPVPDPRRGRSHLAARRAPGPSLGRHRRAVRPRRRPVR